MANTYEKIASVTVGSGGAADIEFTSIPGTFDDLVVKHSLRSDAAQIYEYIGMTFNNNTGSNYNTRNIRGNGATAISQSLSNQTKFELEMMNGNNATANTFSNGEFYIPNYRGSTNKSISSESVSETDATTAYTAMDAGLWAQTAAITSIKIATVVGSNWLQHSTATLYGIKKS